MPKEGILNILAEASLSCPAPDCPDPSNYVKDGHKNGNQRYECKSCDNHFFAEGKPFGKQFTAHRIGDAVSSYYRGQSYKQVAERMAEVYDIPQPAKSTILAWVKGYTRQALRYMAGQVGPDGTEMTATGKRVKANVGDHWVVDETQVDIGGKKVWISNIMDLKTRYILAARLTRGRNMKDTIALFKKAKANSATEPETITSDGMNANPDAIKTVFPNTKHIVAAGLREESNNNASERLQGSIKDRTKVMRGMETMTTAQEYVDGWAFHYNFMRGHEGVRGKTPAEAAGISKPVGPGADNIDKRVPWSSWEDIVRLGGEVAEIKVKKEQITRKKPEPDVGPVKSAAEAYILGKRAKEAQDKANAKIAQRKALKTRVVAPYWKQRRRKGIAGGRGHAAMRASKK